jgi:tellurite resistance protein TerC
MITGILAVGVVASVLAGSRDTAALISPLANDIEELAEVTYRQGRRVVILILGSTVLVFGAAMIILPGPTILVIPLGLSILAVEFAWARRWLAKIREAVGDVKRRLRH